METEFVIWLQKKGEPLHWLLRALSDLGPSMALNALLAGLYWCWDGAAMRRVWLAHLACSWLAGASKLVFQAPRPYWVNPEIQALSSSKGFGMPSGHALVATAVWGELARQWNRLGMRFLFAGIVFGVGISRVYLGVHSGSQVLAGALAGQLFLYLSPALEARTMPRFLRLGLGGQLLALTLSSLAACAVACGARWLASGFELPAEWVSMALEKRPQDGRIHPFSLHSPFLLAGMGFGFFGGYRVLAAWKRDRNARSWRDRALRFLIGGALLGPYGIASRSLLRGEGMADWPLAAALLADYSHGMVIGALVSLAAPLLFHRLKL